MNKEEKLKKLKTKIKRTKVTVISYWEKFDMTSKIKDLDIDVVVIDDVAYFDVTVKQVETMHKLHNVNHHFLYKPTYRGAYIKDCEYLLDEYYEYDYLMSVNSYDMWERHFRECMWCITKALRKESAYDYIN